MDIEKMVDAFRKSPYGLIADGNRGTSRDEFLKVFDILNNEKSENILHALNMLFTYHPDTIELYHEMMSDCKYFNKYSCDCWNPEIPEGESYCERKERKERAESNNRETREYQEWRATIFSRDNYTCQACKKVGGSLNAHHIKSYKNHISKRLDLDNGITLCVNCHRAEHKRLNAIKREKK